MNKRYWIYVGPYGRHNKIGLMHGPNSGNLIIYYNDKIIYIDFKVHNSKSYKFFVDEKLCEIFIIKKKKGYIYEFKFDKKTQTDYNIKQQKRDRKWTIQGLSFVIGFIAFLIIGSAIFFYFRSGFLERQLARTGMDSLVKIRLVKRTANSNYEFFYFYNNHKGKRYVSKPVLSKSQPTLPNGIPFKDGDEFKIRYARNNIFNHKIDYYSPTTHTIISKIQMVTASHYKYNQGRMQSELDCEVQIAYELFGIDGIAKIYSQQVSPSKNKEFNSDTYLKLIRDTPFQEAVQECWNEEHY